MNKYKCIKCGYDGSELIFQFNDYGYCIASNEDEPRYLREISEWLKLKALGEAEIGEPVGCPKCRAWGVNNFEQI